MVIGISILFLLAFLIVLVALRRAYGQVDDEFVNAWAEAHALTLTVESRPVVYSYLRIARVLRTWGALGGLFLGPIVLSAFGFDVRNFFWMWAFLGYLVGALYAELSLARLAPAGERTAGLVRRELADYLPRRLLVGQRVLGVMVALGGVAAALVPYGNRSSGGIGSRRGGVLAAGVIGVVFALGLERVQRLVVRRPQPFTEPALVAADDAIRSQSVHSLAGSGLAVLLVLASFIARALAVSDVVVLRWVMWVPAGFGVAAALFVCLRYGHRGWRVPRSAMVVSSGVSR